MRRILPALALAGVALAGCGGDDDQASAPTPTASSSSTTGPADNAATAVPAALEFTAPAVGGGQVDARAYAGMPVAFWFWAPY